VPRGKLDCLEAVAGYRAVLNDLDISVSADEDHVHASALLGRRVANSDAATVRSRGLTSVRSWPC
jgi:hypothetical protein